MSRLIAVFTILLVACNACTLPKNTALIQKRLANDAAQYKLRLNKAKEHWFWRFRPAILADIGALTASINEIHELLEALEKAEAWWLIRERLANEEAKYELKIKNAKAHWFLHLRPTLMADIAAFTHAKNAVRGLLQAHDEANACPRGLANVIKKLTSANARIETETNAGVTALKRRQKRDSPHEQKSELMKHLYIFLTIFSMVLLFFLSIHFIYGPEEVERFCEESRNRRHRRSLYGRLSSDTRETREAKGGAIILCIWLVFKLGLWLINYVPQRIMSFCMSRKSKEPDYIDVLYGWISVVSFLVFLI